MSAPLDATRAASFKQGDDTLPGLYYLLQCRREAQLSTPPDTPPLRMDERTYAE